MVPALLRSGSVLGVDVGFSEKRRSSAVCRLDWNETEITFEVARFRALDDERRAVLAQVTAHKPISCAAFDGPLRQGLDLIGRYRCAEAILTRGFRPLIGKPGQSSTPVGKQLNQAANACARAVLEVADVATAAHDQRIHDHAVCEAFPTSFLGLMLPNPGDITANRSNRSDLFFDVLARAGSLGDLAEALIPGRRLVHSFESVTNHDERAAIVCALTALCVATGDYTAVGDDDGWIVLPPHRFIRPWALQMLARNCGVSELHPSGPALANGHPMLSQRTTEALE
jgi:Protein of unknown function (DUF429)